MHALEPGHCAKYDEMPKFTRNGRGENWEKKKKAPGLAILPFPGRAVFARRV